MRIGELSTRVGVSTDAIRFYERSGWLPRPARRDNDYRD
jgi:DNA-binding transcriptional MerR regulator